MATKARDCSARVMLAVLVICASFVYLGGIKKNLPYAPEMDEPTIVQRAAWMASESYLDPKWFGHPASTTIYPLAAMFRVSYGTGAAERLTSDPASLYLPARVLSAVYGIGSVVLVFLTGKRIFGRAAAFAGSWLFLFTLVVVEHFQMVRSDSAATFFGWASLYQLCRFYDRPSARNSFLTGILIGLAISSRYFMVTFLVALVLVAWLQVRPTGGMLATARIACIGIVAALIAFAVTTPFFFLDFATAYADLKVEARSSHLGADGLSPLGNITYYLLIAVPASISAAQAVLAAVGLELVVRSRNALSLVLAATTCVFIGAISLSGLHWQRWLIQVLPVFSLLAGYALVWLAALVSGWLKFRSAIGVLALVVLSANPIYRVVLHNIRESRPSTRVLAREWMLANVPSDSAIVQEWYSALLVDTPYKVEEKFSLADRPHHCSYRAEGYDYAVVSSSIYARFFREPERYAGEIRFYLALEESGLLVEEITPGALTGGPTIRIYELSACDQDNPGRTSSASHEGTGPQAQWRRTSPGAVARASAGYGIHGMH